MTDRLTRLFQTTTILVLLVGCASLRITAPTYEDTAVQQLERIENQILKLYDSFLNKPDIDTLTGLVIDIDRFEEVQAGRNHNELMLEQIEAIKQHVKRAAETRKIGQPWPQLFIDMQKRQAQVLIRAAIEIEQSNQ